MGMSVVVCVCVWLYVFACGCMCVRVCLSVFVETLVSLPTCQLEEFVTKLNITIEPFEKESRPFSKPGLTSFSCMVCKPCNAFMTCTLHDRKAIDACIDYIFRQTYMFCSLDRRLLELPVGR